MAKSNDEFNRIPNILRYVRALIKTSHCDWCDGTYDILYVINKQRERDAKRGYDSVESVEFRLSDLMCVRCVFLWMGTSNTPSESRTTVRRI